MADGPTIQVRNNGPYLVRGVKVLDHDGNEIPTPESFAMCRCGQSANKPFCDGTHRSCGFAHVYEPKPQ